MGIRIELCDARKDHVTALRPQNAAREGGNCWVQPLSLELEGITAGDYLAWVGNPEPHGLVGELRSVTVVAEPLGDRIDAELLWEQEPPAGRTAAVAAGFVLTPDVVAVRSSRARPRTGEVTGDLTDASRRPWRDRCAQRSTWSQPERKVT